MSSAVENFLSLKRENPKFLQTWRCSWKCILFPFISIHFLFASIDKSFIDKLFCWCSESWDSSNLGSLEGWWIFLWAFRQREGKKQSAARREDLSVWWVSILHCGLVACKSTVNLWQHCNSWKDELAKAVCMSLKKTWPWGTEIHWCYKARGCQRYFWGHPSLWLQKMGWSWRHLRPHLDVWPTRRRWISDQVPLNQRGRIFWISSYNTFGSSNVELEGRKEQGRLLLGTHIGSSQA